jgi:plasmid stability protein
MSTGGGTRLLRRSFCLVLAAVTASALVSRIASAQDAANAMRELAESTDFRVRVSAALYLGRTKPAGAREVLEHALTDAHPTVRVAAAAALGSLGDAAAIGALSRRLPDESSASVRAQITSSVEQLRRGVAAAEGEPDTGAAQLGPNVHLVVRLGTMRNGSGVRGEDMRRVLQRAAHTRARVLKGAAVIESDPAVIAQASARHLPVLTLDGSLQALTESRVADSVQVQARVEFAIRREQTLRGTLSGAATTFGSGQSLSDQGRRQLQDDAVDGAVQSAMRGAEQGLMIAAR